MQTGLLAGTRSGHLWRFDTLGSGFRDTGQPVKQVSPYLIFIRPSQSADVRMADRYASAELHHAHPVSHVQPLADCPNEWVSSSPLQSRPIATEPCPFAHSEIHIYERASLSVISEAKQPASPQPILALRGHVNSHTQALGLDISPDGQFLVAAGEDNRVRIWSLRTGHQLMDTTGQDEDGPLGGDWRAPIPDIRFWEDERKRPQLWIPDGAYLRRFGWP